MFDSGLTFKCVGQVKEKRNYLGKDGTQKYVVTVMGMGFSQFFSLTAEQYPLCPDQGAVVTVEGPLEVTDFGARMTLQSIKELKPASARAAG